MTDKTIFQEALGLVERIITASEKVDGEALMFSLHGGAAPTTGKNGTFLRPHDITTEMIGARVAHALGKRVGRRREYADDDLAAYIGVSAKTVEKYKAGETPSSVNMMRMVAFFGPEFASEILAPLGMAVVESDSAHAAQCLSIGHLMEMLPQLRNLASTLEASIVGGEGDHD